MKKQILIDGTTISRRIDGLTQYILNVVLNLDAAKADYTLLLRHGECPENYKEMFEKKGLHTEEADIAPIGPIRDKEFAKWLRKNQHRFDCAFCPSNQFPVAMKLPCVYTVHDLIYENFPEQLGKQSRLKRLYLHWNVRQGLRKAAKVVAVSEYTKQEILRLHPSTEEKKIQVIYEGWEHLQLIKQAPYQPPFKKYILYVGSSRGHKNLSRLTAAIALIQEQLPEDWGLIIAGNDRMFTKEQKDKIDAINKQRHTIHLTGWLTDEALAGCFSKASLFIFPSLSEGFGIPVLEAYYYGIPLLLSDKASLPEVAGDAAIYFNPYDEKDMAEKILTAINADHTDLIRRQQERLKQYSWKQTAHTTENILINI